MWVDVSFSINSGQEPVLALTSPANKISHFLLYFSVISFPNNSMKFTVLFGE
jgi:hypothetical protein